MIDDRELVIPGKLLGQGIKCEENCFYEDNKTYSSLCGLARVNDNRVRIIPSAGRYIPKVNDVIIGVVINVLNTRWILDINSPYDAMMPEEAVIRTRGTEDLKKHYDIGDIVSAMVVHVNEVYKCEVGRPWKLVDGLIMNINPKRVPRLIGKKRSMLNMIREKTGNKMVVGQNGRVWIKGDKVDIISKIVRKVEAEAQSRGLTSRISRLLESDVK